VTDAYGNPVPNTVVVFSANAGALTAARVASDSTGTAVTRWTPAAAPQQQSLAVAVRGTTIRTAHPVRVSAPATK
jgi:hypothetical protein